MSQNISQRLERLRDRCTNDFMYSKWSKRLSEAEFDLLVAFIEDNDHLGLGPFAAAASLALVNGKFGKKNGPLIEELLLVANRAVLEHTVSHG